MDLMDIETFLEVAAALNLTKAAERLYVSQSTITHRLKKLEQELDYPLFIRKKGRRAVELTLRGEEFLPIAHKWMNLYQETERLRQNVPRSLSIASVDSAVITVLPPLLRELSRKENKLSVTVQTEHTPKIYEMVRNREADLGLVSFDANLPDIVTRPVFRQRYVMIRPCRQPEAPKTIHPRDLDSAMEIFETWGHAYMQWHNYWWPSSMPHIKVDSLMALKAFLDYEEYWSIVPESSLATVLPRNSLQVYHILEGPPDFVYYLVRQKNPGGRNGKGIRLAEKILAELDNDGPDYNRVQE